ncbi:hypothetical protein ACUIJN_19335 [Metabacillus halosaccharovorans]|uniref:hypothetical protein n=1 Tax=Metabacillus halosaccharovorans TaxID=930124 RepID=UPI0020408D90|nr:hypothetical protein [Metabacillus halosaccharovorans]MCM3441411.1 hypothetical protein [Metabacillus halosaccharovorans]
MLFNERLLDELISDLKTRKVKVERITFAYRSFKNQIKIDTVETYGFALEEDYYENLYENILCSETMWLEPFINLIGTGFEATVAVDEEGDFEHNRIEINASYNINSRIIHLLSYLYKNLSGIVKCYSSVREVTVKGNKKAMSQIIFDITLDGKQLTSMLKEKTVNKKYLEQWLVIIDKCDQEIIKRDKYLNTFKVLNGKINYETRMELTSQIFKLPEEMKVAND